MIFDTMLLFSRESSSAGTFNLFLFYTGRGRVMLLSRSESDQRLVAMRYERNNQVQQLVEEVTNTERSKQVFTENLLWALNECETNDLSVDDREAIETNVPARPLTVRRPMTVGRSNRSSVAPARALNRQYIVHSKFPLLVNDYFHNFKNTKLTKNLCLLQDYQVGFSTERMPTFHSNLIKSYCKLLDSYESFD